VSSKRVTATDRVREEIDGLFADRDRDLGEVLEEVARLSVRLVMQSALEAEVTEFLGRERYARGERARAGSRNGYGDTTIKTTAGAVELKRPKVRGTLEKFSSRLLGKHVTRTNALESLVISGWVRGLSDRDIEAALREALGDDATVSKSTVSRICEQIKDEFAKWRTRDLSEVTIDYLFVDASHFKMHDGARSEPVLAAYGITTEGNPVFLHLDGVSAESTDACVGFLEDMVARGLGSLGVWVRMHYVYPYPHVDHLIGLMNAGRILPYLDIPFQHGSRRVLKAMRRPAASENTLARIQSWRRECPELIIRSTFIVGFPGETEEEFEELLDWLREARLDRVGAFEYSPVEGARANALADPVSDEVKHERWQRFMRCEIPRRYRRGSRCW